MTTNEDRGQAFSRYVAIEMVAAATRKEMTSGRLAALSGIHPVTLSNYVHGKGGPMVQPVVLRACEVLGEDPGALVARAYAALVRDLGEAPTARPGFSVVEAEEYPDDTPPVSPSPESRRARPPAARRGSAGPARS